MIRVIRVLEYIFANNDVAERHLAVCEVPLNGAKQFGLNMTIRSSGIVELASLDSRENEKSN